MDTPGFKLWLRCWKVEVGRTNLYLLDSNDLANPPAFRGVTSELYGGDSDLRLKQELILGIGGWRLLRALGLRPEICHLNEGHAAFAILERARSYMDGQQRSVRCGAGGNPRRQSVHHAHGGGGGLRPFPPELAGKYLKVYRRGAWHRPGRASGAWAAKIPTIHRSRSTWLTWPCAGAALSMASAVCMAQVSRRLFSSLFPRWPEREVPVAHVTNGVHVGTWESPETDALWERACGPDRSAGEPAKLAQQLRALPDTDLWQLRTDGIEGIDRVHAPAPGARARQPGSAARR